MEVTSPSVVAVALGAETTESEALRLRAMTLVGSARRKKNIVREMFPLRPVVIAAKGLEGLEHTSIDRVACCLGTRTRASPNRGKLNS